jgi:4-hydroxy-tetrahydrodipicolinate reductase
MVDFPEYEKNIIEIHHNQKIDAPSGTAITLAEKILDYNSELENWVLNTYGKSTDLSIFSIREKNVPGTHVVNYISDIDKITIKHEAFGREGFAQGAVRAAEFLRTKKGVYSMEELLAE